MRTFFNKIRIPLWTAAVFMMVILFSSCDKGDVEIQNNFPFEVQVMPVPKEIAKGQTVEIRFTIQRSGSYRNTKYFLRYFQFDGQGSLNYFHKPPYLPNDIYNLPAEQFRLYYTSNSAVSQSFDVWISDNFGNERKISFQFNSSD